MSDFVCMCVCWFARHMGKRFNVKLQAIDLKR